MAEGLEPRTKPSGPGSPGLALRALGGGGKARRGWRGPVTGVRTAASPLAAASVWSVTSSPCLLVQSRPSLLSPPVRRARRGVELMRQA